MNVPDKIVIECPQCSNRYEIEVAAISEEGTNLKCASCEHEWAVKKVVEQATPTNTETEKKPKTEENTKPKTPSIPFQRKKPDESKLKKPEFKSVSPSGCTVFFVLIPILSFLFGAFVVASRQDIIRVVPAVNSIYEAWGIKTPQSHLKVLSSEAKLETIGEDTVLKITGEISNMGSEQVNTLPIRVDLLDKSDRKLMEKFATISSPEFSAGSILQYEVEFKDPPSNWHSHEVTIVGVSRSQ